MSPGESWAAWLHGQLDERRITAADLSRAGGLKPNGRPVIDPSTITQWLRGRRPSYELAVAVADALGRPRDEALRAAGYGGELPGAVRNAAREAAQRWTPNVDLVRKRLDTARIAIDQAMAALDQMEEE